jgi:chemotaxis protein MotB
MAKKKAEAHHGGAWKVAYADFVTAMMALFMVLWISSQDKKILIATSHYFQNPFHSPMNANSGVMPFNSNKTTQSQGSDAGSEKEQASNRAIQLTFLNSVAADFYRLLHLDQDLEDKPIDIQVTTDGLRITLFDRSKNPLFVDDTTTLTQWGDYTLQSLAWLIDQHHFRVTIDGHTRAKQSSLRPDYSNWELSADRANAARRALVHYAVDLELIERVTGYADTRPLPDQPADAETNQRITLSLTLSSKPGFKDKSMTDAAVPITHGPAAEVMPDGSPAAIASPESKKPGA